MFWNKVIFAGAGPGVADLITVRLLNRIKEADIIIYAGSLVDIKILSDRKESCEVLDSAYMNLDEIVDTIIKGFRTKKNVLRVHTGDPAIYGAIKEQMHYLDKEKITYEVIPGVSSVFAAAAALKKELTAPEVSQTVILTRMEGRTPVPPKERIELLAQHSATMALYLSVANITALCDALILGGYKKTTPVNVVYRASWPDQKIVCGTLEDISQKINDANITRQAIILVGDALSETPQKSLLYDKNFAHGYRKSFGNKPKITTQKNYSGRFYNRCAIWSITKNGAKLSARMAKYISAVEILPESNKSLAYDKNKSVPFKKGSFKKVLSDNFNKYDAHIFVMATGIIIRSIASLLKDKTADPAIVLIDEKARFAVSLLSGHIGGANDLANEISEFLGAIPVITTATDINNRIAFDSVASKFGWKVTDKNKIKILNSMLLKGEKIYLDLPNNIEDKFWGNYDFISHLNSTELSDCKGIVSLGWSADKINEYESKFKVTVLNWEKPSIFVGMGCKKDTSYEEIIKLLEEALVETGYDISDIKNLASVNIKSKENCFSILSEKYSKEFVYYTPEELAKVLVPTPSKKVSSKIGTGSVSEASAILASSNGNLILKKKKGENSTIAIAVENNYGKN